MSSNPRFFPQILNGWHGNPPHKMSNSCGIFDFVSSKVMSPYGVSPKLFLYVSCADLFHSEENTHSPPTFCNARRNPPMPANRSINLN